MNDALRTAMDRAARHRPASPGIAALAAIWACLLAQMLTAQAPPPSNPGTAVLDVGGDVATPLVLKADELAKMPRETVSIPAPDGAKNDYEGVPLREILKRAGAPIGKLRGKALTGYVVAEARDGYAVVFTLGELDPEFGNATVLVADKLNGKALPESQGPLRLVCPNDKAGARSVRFLTGLQVVQLRK